MSPLVSHVQLPRVGVRGEKLMPVRGTERMETSSGIGGGSSPRCNRTGTVSRREAG
jgi:hypothetical protein